MPLLKSNNTALTVAPFPSVALFHACVTLKSASVVFDPGIVPNCFGSTFAGTAGFTCCSSTNSSATFDSAGVREIGRKCLFSSYTGTCFGIGTISAYFQDCGSRASANEQLIQVTSGSNKSSFSLSSQDGIMSGPEDWAGFSAESFFSTKNSETKVGLG